MHKYGIWVPFARVARDLLVGSPCSRGGGSMHGWTSILMKEQCDKMSEVQNPQIDGTMGILQRCPFIRQ
jgi:hypothetical protein